MNLTIQSKVARKYGLHTAAVMGYLKHQEHRTANPEGWFTAPVDPLSYAYKIKRPTFNRSRDALEHDGIIETRSYPHKTEFRINTNKYNALLERDET